MTTGEPRAGFRSSCSEVSRRCQTSNLHSSATTRDHGAFPLQGTVLCKEAFPQESPKSHPLGICSFQAFHLVILGCVRGDFSSPSVVIFITHGCEVDSAGHNSISPIWVSQDRTHAITASCTCSLVGPRSKHSFTVRSPSCRTSRQQLLY